MAFCVTRFLGCSVVVGVVLAASIALAGPGGGGQPGDSCGLFRRASRTFFLTNQDVDGGAVAVADSFGPGGDLLDPVPGDFDGNGSDTFGVYSHERGLFFLSNSNSPGPAVLASILPAIGDFDDDGSDDLAVYLPRFGVFRGDINLRFGGLDPSVVPICGNWDGI